MKKSLFVDIAGTFVTRIFLLGASFFVSILLARLLGPEGKGIVTAVFVIPNIIISLADLGIRQSTAYFIGKKIFEKEAILSSVSFIWIITSIISIVIVAIYYSTGPNEIYGWGILSIAILTIPLFLIQQYANGILQGLQHIGAINKMQIGMTFVNIIGIVLLVWLMKLDIIGAALVQLLIALYVAVYSIFLIKKNIRFSFKKVYPSIQKQLFTKGIAYAVTLFILNLNYKIDIIFLERLTNKSDVGIFSVGTSLAELIWQIPAAIGMVLFSKSANTTSERESVLRAAQLLRITTFLLIFICGIFWVASPVLVSILYGNDYLAAINVIRYLLPGILIMVIFKILNADLAGRGYPLFALSAYSIPLVVNIVLNIYLIPKYGIDGAAIASSISYSIGGITFALIYSKKEQVKLKDLLIVNMSDFNKMVSKFKKIRKH